MIQGFAPQTEPLTDYERDTLLPVICRGLSNKIGEARAVTNATITKAMRSAGYQLNEARVRKIINHIRTRGMVRWLIATSKGYYIATSADEVDDCIASIQGRIASQQAIIDALKDQQQKYFN